MKYGVCIVILLLALPWSALAQDATATPEQESDTPVFLRQWAAEASASSQFGTGEAYSPVQATGAPDTIGCVDATTAWASESKNGTETLELVYETPVYPLQVNVHQNIGNGAIVGIDLVPAEGGDPISLPKSADPRTECPGVFRVQVSLDTPVLINRVIIHFDQSLTEYWNEIDAVELVGLRDEAALEKYVLQWASKASATSEYTPDAWNAAQATGEPNSFGCGDIGTAWASATGTGVDDLTVYFEEAVLPVELNIYQTYNPGAITGVDLLPAEGSKPIPVPDSADPGTECPGVLKLDLTQMDDLLMIQGVVIHLDQTLTGSWNEIDAVELVGVKP